MIPGNKCSVRSALPALLAASAFLLTALETRATTYRGQISGEVTLIKDEVWTPAGLQAALPATTIPDLGFLSPMQAGLAVTGFYSYDNSLPDVSFGVGQPAHNLEIELILGQNTLDLNQWWFGFVPYHFAVANGVPDFWVSDAWAVGGTSLDYSITEASFYFDEYDDLPGGAPGFEHRYLEGTLRSSPVPEQAGTAWMLAMAVTLAANFRKRAFKARRIV